MPNAKSFSKQFSFQHIKIVTTAQQPSAPNGNHPENRGLYTLGHCWNGCGTRPVRQPSPLPTTPVPPPPTMKRAVCGAGPGAPRLSILPATDQVVHDWLKLSLGNGWFRVWWSHDLYRKVHMLTVLFKSPFPCQPHAHPCKSGPPNTESTSGNIIKSPLIRQMHRPEKESSAIRNFVFYHKEISCASRMKHIFFFLRCI